MKTTTPRTLVQAATACALAAAAALPAAAQGSYPSRPVTLIVPYAAGGNVDAVARWVAPELGKRLGQQVVIENVAGAGGIIGTDRAARAPADGHTLLLSVESTIVIAKMVSPSTVKYDGLKDFAPVTLLSNAPLVLVGRPTLPAANLDELLKLMAREPGKLNYATSGIGTSLHVAGEMFNQIGGVQMNHVPYRVGAQIVTDLMGNQIDLAMLPIPLTSEQVKTGRVKAFGVTEGTRSPALPDVPSMAEHPKLKGVDVTVWFGIFAPAKTDPAIVAKLHRETAEVLKDEALRQKFGVIGMRPLGLGPEAFARFLEAEQAKFSEIVRLRNIRAE
jgi:tripartite-type tricarboxylate transporter receptor subunit TctC